MAGSSLKEPSTRSMTPLLTTPRGSGYARWRLFFTRSSVKEATRRREVFFDFLLLTRCSCSLFPADAVLVGGWWMADPRLDLRLEID